MPCYDCTSLGYGASCQDCSRFVAVSPRTPTPPPTSDTSFSFEYASPLKATLPELDMALSSKYSSPATPPPHWNWLKLETAKPTTKTSRFNWADLSANDSASDDSTAESESTAPSDSDAETVIDNPNLRPQCFVCTMVPYGALCTNCSQIKTSKAITLATPPAASWPVTRKLGDWDGEKIPEEKLLQNLDMELFDLINVPHELDEWGRRVWDDCGRRILYCQNSDGETVIGGYEAWYPCSVTGEYEEPDEYRVGKPIHHASIDNDDQQSDYECFSTLEDEQNIADEDYGCTFHSENDDTCTLDHSQQRFAQYLAASDEDLPQISSNKERIAAWIASFSVADDKELRV